MRTVSYTHLDVYKRQEQADIRKLVAKFEAMNLKVGVTNGVGCTILGLVGDTVALDEDEIMLNEHVERVMRVQEPYKKANRKFHPEDTIVDVNGVKVGGGNFAVMAGPCSVESEDQIVSIAKAVSAAGAGMLRGGAFKPRTSPYSFQGMGVDGLKLLLEAKAETGMPIVTELMGPQYCELFEEKVDLVQIGARNMQNFDLLKDCLLYTSLRHPFQGGYGPLRTVVFQRFRQSPPKRAPGDGGGDQHPGVGSLSVVVFRHI